MLVWHLSSVRLLIVTLMDSMHTLSEMGRKVMI